MYTLTVTDHQIRNWQANPTRSNCLCPLSAALQASLPENHHVAISLAQPGGGTIYGYASRSYDAQPVAMYQPVDDNEQAACDFIRDVDSHMWPEQRTFIYKRVW